MSAVSRALLGQGEVSTETRERAEVVMTRPSTCTVSTYSSF